MPYETGGGYWSEDPTLAGWKPPSKYIWSYRIAASPGIVWARPPANEDPEGIGIFNESVLVAVEKDRLIGIDVSDGSLLWNHSELDRIDDALLDAKEPIIYTTNQFGRISAYAFVSPESGSEQNSELSEEPLWTVDHDVVGFPTLMPLSDGGVVLFVRDQLIAVAADGRQLWELESITRPYDWAQTDDGLVFATMGRDRSLWIINGSDVHCGLSTDRSLNPGENLLVETWPRMAKARTSMRRTESTSLTPRVGQLNSYTSSRMEHLVWAISPSCPEATCWLPTLTAMTGA
jgi:hypothetical protein